MIVAVQLLAALRVTVRVVPPPVSIMITLSGRAESSSSSQTFTNVKNADEEGADYLLTIHYRYQDGRVAGDTYTHVYKAGDVYDVLSPAIPDYRAVPVRVTGVMPGRDVEYTVIYIPEDLIPEDPDTPLGLGEVTINVGECLE